MVPLRKTRSNVETIRFLGRGEFVLGRLRVRRIQVELSRRVARAQGTEDEELGII